VLRVQSATLGVLAPDVEAVVHALPRDGVRPPQGVGHTAHRLEGAAGGRLRLRGDRLLPEERSSQQEQQLDVSHRDLPTEGTDTRDQILGAF
jgi:hypothetical protein